LAKQYHPDARASAKGEERSPNADKFRDVVEAYQVLSVRESRVTYDIQRRKNPDRYRAIS
jgi:DnaJ-class molecular chaperone